MAQGKASGLIGCLLASTLYLPSGQAEIYRCTSAEGHTVYTPSPCPGRGVDTGIAISGYDPMSSAEARALTRQRADSMTRAAKSLQRFGVSRHNKGVSVAPRRNGHGAEIALARACGRLFDGVNAVNLEELERSLKMRLERDEKDQRDIAELRCRINKLHAARGARSPFARR